MNDYTSTREIIDQMVKQSGITKKLAAEILHVFPDIIEDGLKKDGEVRVKGFGTFRLKWMRGKMGRNPKTGERVEIPPHNRVVFLPEQAFKEYLNRDYRLLGYKIIPPAEQISSVDKITPEPEPEHEPLPQFTEPEHEPILPYRPEHEFQPEPQPESPPGKQKAHWIIPLAISTIIILSLIFYFRNCYHEEVGSQQSTVNSQQSAVGSQQSTVSSQQSAVGSQQSAVGSQRPVPMAEPEETASEIVITEGNHLFKLAREIYGNPYLWVLIYRENQDKIPDPDMLISGKEVVIPELEGTPERLTKKDSLAVSEGYRLLYEYYRAKGDPRTDDFFRAMNRYKPL